MSSRPLAAFLCALMSETGQSSDNHYGPFAISKTDHRDLWDGYLALDPDKSSLVRGLASQHRFLQDPEAELTCNLAYSVAIAAILLEKYDANNFTSLNFYELSRLWFIKVQKQSEIELTRFLTNQRQLIDELNKNAA